MGVSGVAVGVEGVEVGGTTVGVAVGGTPVGVAVNGTPVGVAVGGTAVGVAVGGAEVGVTVGVSVGGTGVGVNPARTGWTDGPRKNARPIRMARATAFAQQKRRRIHTLLSGTIFRGRLGENEPKPARRTSLATHRLPGRS